MTPDTLAPHHIVENARAYMRSNISKRLSIATVAKGIGVSSVDLKGSYLCSTPTTFDKDLIKIRMEVLYKAITDEPWIPIEQHIKVVGLEDCPQAHLEFEDAFWISIDDHRKNCLCLK